MVHSEGMNQVTESQSLPFIHAQQKQNIAVNNLFIVTIFCISFTT